MLASIKLIVSLLLTIGVGGQSKAEEVDPEYQMIQPVRPAFSIIDLDFSGEIDFDEFSTHKLPADDAHKPIFDEMDLDENGVISEEEFNNHRPYPVNVI